VPLPAAGRVKGHRALVYQTAALTTLLRLSRLSAAKTASSAGLVGYAVPETPATRKLSMLSWLLAALLMISEPGVDQLVG